MIRKLSRPRLLGGDRDDTNDGCRSPIELCQFAQHSAHPVKQRRSTTPTTTETAASRATRSGPCLHGENHKHGFRVVVCSCFLRPRFEELTKLIAWRSRRSLPGFGMVCDKNVHTTMTDGQKHTFGGRKRILRPPRTIPIAILLVETIGFELVVKPPTRHTSFDFRKYPLHITGTSIRGYNQENTNLYY
jgi:hypothetical protein